METKIAENSEQTNAERPTMDEIDLSLSLHDINEEAEQTSQDRQLSDESSSSGKNNPSKSPLELFVEEYHQLENETNRNENDEGALPESLAIQSPHKTLEGKQKTLMLNRALNLAALDENVQQVKMLLARGADPNWQNTSSRQYGNTALHHVAFKGNAEIVNMLVYNGADTEIENKYGNKAFMFACYYGRLSVMKSLMSLGVDMTSFSRRTGLTALHKACMQGHTRVVRLLLKNGAYPNALDFRGRRPEDVIGVDGEREVSLEEQREILELLRTEGARLYSTKHHHELAFTVVSVSTGSKCSLCSNVIAAGTPQFICPLDNFIVCQSCLDATFAGAEGTDAFTAMLAVCRKFC